MNPVLAALGRALLDSTLAVAIVASASRLFPRLPAASRANLWWLASLGALVGLMPLTTLRTPQPLPPQVQIALDPAGALAGALATGPAPAPSWPWALLALWALGAVVVLAKLVREQARLDAIWRRAEPVAGERVARWAWSWLKAPGWAAVPAIRQSDETTVPLTIGWLRPRILVPRAADDDTLRLALAHEFAHVRRHDLLFGWVPALAQVALWFSPFVVWGGREYGQAREEACDAEALRLTEVAPRAYGELLLHFGVAQPMPSSAVALCGSRTKVALERRLKRLERFHAGRGARLAGAVAMALVAAVILPVRVTWGGQGEFGYAFHRAGEKGTRGSLRENDFDAIERILRDDPGEFWMFRLGGQRWVVRDGETIAYARQELAPEDRADQEMAPVRRRMAEIDGWLTDLQVRLAELDRKRGADAEQARAKLRAEIDQLERGREDALQREERGRRRMEAARPEMEARMSALAREAIAAGKAERVR
jgi:beta-lactamase regulating signal transducer with metallopeptidase domain